RIEFEILVAWRAARHPEHGLGLAPQIAGGLCRGWACHRRRSRATYETDRVPACRFHRPPSSFVMGRLYPEIGVYAKHIAGPLSPNIAATAKKNPPISIKRWAGYFENFQALEIEGHACVVIATVRIELRSANRRAKHVGAVCREARTGTKRIGIPLVGVR